MKNLALVKKVARRHSIKPAAAADRIDREIDRIVRTLKRGEPARLPGLGTLIPGRNWEFQQDPDES